MIYPKRIAWLLPVTSFLSSIIVTAFLKPYIDSHFKGHGGYPVVLVGTALTIFTLTWVALYFLVLMWTCAFRGDVVSERLAARWRQRLDAVMIGAPGRIDIADHLDRVADIHIRLSRPSVMDKLIPDLLQGKEKARKAAEGERDELLCKRDFAASIRILANRWRSSEVAQPRKPRLIDDPVHSCVALDGALATVVSHPMLQRLNRVRQLSFSYSQFPSATHSRLSHCLGVARNAEIALARILDLGVYYEVGAPEPKPFPPEILAARN